MCRELSEDKLKEECGVFGFYDNDGYPTARMIYYGLYALQHRGQESCGIAVNDDGVIHSYKNMGLVNEVFNNENVAALTGKIGVGHVRYSAAAEATRENAQPLVSRYKKGTLTIALNGNIVNASEIRSGLENEGAIFQSTNDAELILHLAAKTRAYVKSVEDAMLSVMYKLNGAYSIVMMSPRKLLGIRDPYGFRPLCIGKLDNSYVLASESAGLDVIKAKFVRDVEPGEIVIIDHKGIRSIKYTEKVTPALCVFEYVYFARPDSVIDGVSVYQTRVKTGKLLASTQPVEADVVIGVPDSGLNFALGYSLGSGIPLGDGLVKNRYTGRTFIKPNQDDRVEAVNIKLNVLRDTIEGKRVVMVDDSIVRGTTCSNIIRMLKDNGAKEVHMRVASPKFLWPCFFGTDIPSRKVLIAVKMTTEEIRKKIGADSLAFLDVADIPEIGIRKDFGYCSACFTGEYPVDVGNVE